MHNSVRVSEVVIVSGKTYKSPGPRDLFANEKPRVKYPLCVCVCVCVCVWGGGGGEGELCGTRPGSSTVVVNSITFAT